MEMRKEKTIRVGRRVKIKVKDNVITVLFNGKVVFQVFGDEEAILWGDFFKFSVSPGSILLVCQRGEER